jgi:citrate synthase
VAKWLTSEQAAARLGVKPETLYAYVSRGVLASEREPGGRRSRYLRADVERLAARQRSGGRAGGLEIIVETELTRLDPTGHLYYRGWDVEDAVSEAGFEEVATWLWTGERAKPSFDAPAALKRAAKPMLAATRALPPIDVTRAVLVAIRTVDPLRDDRRPDAVAATGRGLIATVVESLPTVGAGTKAAEPSIAARLWPRLTDQAASRPRVATLDAVLVLLADHELAASTFAARVAASTWADPYLVVQAGLAALGGPLHGGSSEAARQVIGEIRRGDATVEEAIGRRLREGQHIPGFGHNVYIDRDPRADVLLRLLEAEGSLKQLRPAVKVIDTMRQRGLPFVNIDFTLALFAEAHRMVPGATEVIFAVARMAGWLAHAAEEYEHRLRFRPRATYVGPRP